MNDRLQEDKRVAAREAERRYRERNREVLAEKARLRRVDSPEHVRKITRESMRKAVAANPEKYRAAWRANNRRRYDRDRDAVLAQNAARRKKEACAPWADRFLIAEMYRLARARTRATGVVWEVDHIVPLQNNTVCGLHVQDNLRIVPRSFNRAKRNELTPEATQLGICQVYPTEYL